MSSSQEHIFLTALGVVGRLDQKYPYRIGKKTFHAQLAPLALLESLSRSPKNQPTRILTLVTKGSETTTWPLFERRAQEITRLVPEPVSIPDGQSGREVREIKIANPLPKLLITHALRSSLIEFLVDSPPDHELKKIVTQNMTF